MGKKSLSVIVFLMAFTTMLKGYEQMDPGEPDMKWGPEIQGCRCSIVSDRETYRFDQPIRLRMKLENIGEQTVHVLESGHSSLMTVAYRVEVRLPNGEPAPLTLEGKREANIGTELSVSLIRLDPGKSWTATIPMLNRIYDMTLRGEYNVTVYRQLAPRQSGEKPIEVKSNTLEIVVHDREEERSPEAPR
jgi:hypothetical protein